MKVNNLKSAIIFLEDEVNDNDDGQDYFSDAQLIFENNWDRLKETGKEEEIVEEIISQLTSASSAEGFGMVRTNDNAYGVYANYGVDDEEDFFISVNVVDYSKQGTAEYTILRTEVLDRWDDDSEQEHSEHQKYLKDIADDFLRLVDNIKVDGRLGKLLFLKSWKQILKRGDK